MRARLFAASPFALVLIAHASTYGLASPKPSAEADAQSSGATTPRVINGRLVPQAAGSNLDATFHRLAAAQAEPVWIGYSVPAVQNSGDRRFCCGDTWISDGVVIT